MGLSDFCMEPTQNVVASLNGLGDIQQTAKYYALCRGKNPIHQHLADSYALRDVVGKQLVSFFDSKSNPSCVCCQDRMVIDSYRSLQKMYITYQNIADLLNCERIHNTWIAIFERALCSNTMIGVFGLWIAGIIAAVGVFLVSIAASVLMLYFDEFWELQHSMEDKVQHIREDNAKLLSSATDSDTDGEYTNIVT